MRRTLIPVLFAVVLIPSVLAGCSSETRDKAKDAAESAKDDMAEGVDSATAHAQAEALRASLKADSKGDREGLRSIEVIQENVDDLPGNPSVKGLDDADGDGKDDDGKLTFTVRGRSVCVTIPTSGEDLKVSSGAC